MTRGPVFQIQIHIQLVTWIRIRIQIPNANPDSEGEKLAQKWRQINSEDQKKMKSNAEIFVAVIFSPKNCLMSKLRWKKITTRWTFLSLQWEKLEPISLPWEIFTLKWEQCLTLPVPIYKKYWFWDMDEAATPYFYINFKIGNRNPTLPLYVLIWNILWNLANLAL
jgi:hypothetical protein